MRAVVALALLASCRFDVDRLAGDGADPDLGDGGASIDGLSANDGAATVDVPPPGDGAQSWDGASCDGIGDPCGSSLPACAPSLMCHFNTSGGACTTSGRPGCNPLASNCPPEASRCLEDGDSMFTGVCASDFELFCLCTGLGNGAFRCPF